MVVLVVVAAAVAGDDAGGDDFVVYVDDVGPVADYDGDRATNSDAQSDSTDRQQKAER